MKSPGPSSWRTLNAFSIHITNHNLDLDQMLKNTVPASEVRPSLATLNTYDNALSLGWTVCKRHPNILTKTGLSSRIPFCNDCQTLHPSPYMVHDSVWRVVNPVCTARLFLCFTCLEQRLGRPLVLGDFTHAPLNDPIHLGYAIRGRENPQSTHYITTT